MPAFVGPWHDVDHKFKIPERGPTLHVDMFVDMYIGDSVHQLLQLVKITFIHCIAIIRCGSLFITCYVE